MDKLFLSVTGYYGSGSSAIVDFLNGYRTCAIASPTDIYEHTPFYMPGGLFDLAGLLLSPYVSPYTSDKAINAFIACAKRLNNNNFGWFGSYKHYYGDEYMNMVDKFVRKIAVERDRNNASHVKSVKFSPIKVLLQIAAKVVYNRKVHKWGRNYVYDKEPGFFSLPTEEEFYEAAKEYTLHYMKMCSVGDSVNIFDHLIWPQQSKVVDRLFPDNFKVIIVDRDPRDVFLLNKYFWFKPPVSTAPPFFPTEEPLFIDEWRRTVVLKKNTNNVLHVQFENFVYNFNEEKARIEAFLGLDSTDYDYTKSLFDPSKSIENTQIFRFSPQWDNEVAVISKSLSEYLYDFPYERVPDCKKWFDS